MRIPGTAILSACLLGACGGGGAGPAGHDPPPEPPPAFVKHAGPVWEGTYVAGDPCVIRYGGKLRMYYTSVDAIDGVEHIMIASAESDDGIAWTKSAPAGDGESIALDVTAGWDRYLETAEVVARTDGMMMWYGGYPAEAADTGKTVANGEIGLATSGDGITFTRSQTTPVLARGTSADPDWNALFSPAVVLDGGTYYMLYTGWAIDDAPATPFIGILGATSSDGVTWTKRSAPVLDGPSMGLAWIGTVKEVDLVKGPDGVWYLFFSSDGGIGLARSATSPFGPWDIHPEPVLVADQAWESEVIAPSVLIEDGRMRMWYMGFQPGFTDFAIGYAEAAFPFDWSAGG